MTLRGTANCEQTQPGLAESFVADVKVSKHSSGKTGIEEAAALAYLADGWRLRTNNMSSLAEVQDQVCVSSFPLIAHSSFLHGNHPKNVCTFPSPTNLLG